MEKTDIMIINIRGTNGAGKSTIVRSVINKYPCMQYLMLPKHRKPAGYFCTLSTYNNILFIPGHYQIANGGIDTLKLDLAYKLILTMHEFGCNVLYEGQNMGDKLERILGIHKAGIDIRIIFIDHPLDKCIADVRKRGHTIIKETITTIYKKCGRQQTQLENNGVNCLRLTRKNAEAQIMNWLQS